MDFSDLVGIPWRERGREPEGCDCWGLARLAYQAAGFDLPSFADAYATTADRAAIDGLIAGHRGPWVAVPAGAARVLDLVLMRERPWHVGIVVRPGWMLHMPARQTSVIEQYTTGRHARRVEGIYRHEGLS